MREHTIYDIRRANLIRLLAEPGAKTALAGKLGTTQSHITHMVTTPGKNGAKPIHEDKARQIEAALGLALGELDHDVTRPPEAIAALSPAMDWRMLDDAIQAVIAAIVAHDLPANSVAGVARHIYEHGRKASQVDTAFAAQLIKLLK